jgi:hypothetical protein
MNTVLSDRNKSKNEKRKDAEGEIFNEINEEI